MYETRFYELRHLLTADETANKRAALPLAEWVTMLKEYNQMIDKQQLAQENREFYEVFTMLNEGRQKPGQDIGELSAGDLDQYIATRSNEADRLMASLDNELLGPAERQPILDRLNDLTGELKRARQVQRKLERRAAVAY